MITKHVSKIALVAVVLAFAFGMAAVSTSHAQTTVVSSGYMFTRVLTIGSTGQDVMNLQVYLNANGYLVASVGAGSPGHESMYFGSKTKAALAAFQAAHGIQPAVAYF